MTIFKPFNLGCDPSPGTPFETLLQDGWDAFLLFCPHDESAVIVVECESCASSRFGYPNDEGLPEHPHYHDGISSGNASFFISDDTPWLRDVANQKAESSRRIWGGRNMTVPAGRGEKLFHFIAPMKEATFECIASNLKIVHRAKGFEDAFSYVRMRFSQH